MENNEQNQGAVTADKNESAGVFPFINFKVPKEMAPMIEEIRAARAARFEGTQNTDIARDAIKALYEKVVK